MEKLCGSLEYLSPEVNRDSNPRYVTTKADMWAMGVIIYRIATAYTPRMVDDYKYGKCVFVCSKIK